MPDIKHVLTTVAYEGWHLDALREIVAPAPLTVLDPDDAAGIAELLPQVDVAVLRADLDERYVSTPNVRWIHCDHAGLNKSARPQFLRRDDLIITGSAGRAAPALAQHCLFLMLALIYDAPTLELDRQDHAWRKRVDLGPARCLYGKTVGIIGMGHTGHALASLLKACGSRILAYGRGVHQRPPEADQYFDASLGETIDTILTQSDVVVLSIRLTDETYHMIDAAALAKMKPSAHLINMARGSVVDEAALVDALYAGTIAGAGLDVFEQEPLPPDAAIWDAPHVIMTPHQTAEMPDLKARSLDILSENFRRYRADEPLLGRLRASDAYSHA
ncbi:MAG: D-2-hydroxyacid dehydrogenase [Propionibacteriaceae bacterium]|jgi:phosphoglycerate dehydrogenase-like enzyme|nr:D-2-hydroxyacid dehydrogenase [Propionibacteriaceae bacterium]